MHSNVAETLMCVAFDTDQVMCKDWSQYTECDRSCGSEAKKYRYCNENPHIKDFKLCVFVKCPTPNDRLATSSSLPPKIEEGKYPNLSFRIG